MLNRNKIKEYYRIFRVRMLRWKNTDEALKEVIYAMANDSSAAVRYAAYQTLQHLSGPDIYTPIEKYRYHLDLPEPTDAYFLAHLYPDGKYDIGVATCLLSTNWIFQPRDYRVPVQTTDGNFKLRTLESFDFRELRLSYGLDVHFNSLIENDLVLGIYTRKDWAYMCTAANVTLVLAEGIDAERWRTAINQHPHFATGNTITPSFVIRGQIRMEINSWGEYPDAVATQSYLNDRKDFRPWKDHRQSNDLVEDLKQVKFRSGYTMQFSTIGDKYIPGVLRLITDLEQGIWEAELHFPSKIEINISGGVLIERSCEWYEIDMIGNFISKQPIRIMCKSTRILGEFMRHKVEHS